MRKFFAGRILEVPLIVLQYYKPSFSLYIYIYKEGPLFITIYNFNIIKIIKRCAVRNKSDLRCPMPKLIPIAFFTKETSCVKLVFPKLRIAKSYQTSLV